MSAPVKLDEFLRSQSSGSTATLEPIPDKPTRVKVTPFHGDRGCGCASSFELPRDMIHSVTPTGQFHFCCGKRLEVVVVEFAEHASVPVADLMKRIDNPGHHAHATSPFETGAHRVPTHAARPSGARRAPTQGRAHATPQLVGSWPIPFTECYISCIEVCVDFCSDDGWLCCGWETRCALVCPGWSMQIYPITTTV
jgi:hypothetical protein